MLRKFVWTLAGLSILLGVADTFLVAHREALWSQESIGIHGWPLVNIASIGASIIGALIVSANRRQPIGWLLTSVGIATSISLVAETLTLIRLDDGDNGTLTHVLGWAASMFGGVYALSALTMVFLLLPDGRLLSRRWRVILVASPVGYVMFTVGVLTLSPDTAVGTDDTEGRSLLTELLLNVGVLMVTISLIIAVIGMLIRLKRSTGDARQQLRLVAFGAAAVALALIILLVGQIINGGRQTAATSIPLSVAYLVLLICIAFAVLRYRLYDVDVIISRAVVLTSATIFVAVGYIVIVVAVGGSLGDKSGKFWPSLLATAVVAMAFQPLRSRIIRFADHLAYGDRAAPYDALAAFSRDIGASPAPDSLLPAVAEAAGRAARAKQSVARIDLNSEVSQAAAWPEQSPSVGEATSTTDLLIPVADEVGELGSISLKLTDGRELDDVDRQLLRDLADQAALAFRNARLELELAAQVESLDQQTTELAASRRRIIDAADAERQRLEAAISRDVLPTLSGLREELARQDDADVEPEAVAALVDDATAALEALRDLTRGIYPTMLTRIGLAAALTSYFGRLDGAAQLIIDQSLRGRRFSPRVEAAAYFCCVEAVRSARSRLRVTIQVADKLTIALRGDLQREADRAAMLDRVAACGGSIVIGPDESDDLDVSIELPADPPIAQPADVAALHS